MENVFFSTQAIYFHHIKTVTIVGCNVKGSVQELQLANVYVQKKSAHV